MEQHRAYEHFILETLVPFIRQDCRQPHARMVAAGCSMGAMYSSLFALKFPETFKQALCMSGRYRGASFVKGGGYDESLYFNDPLAFLPGLEGAALERVRRNTHLTLVVGRGAFEGSCIPETIELAASSVVVSEAAPAATIVVRRRGGALGESSFAWWTSDGTARAGDDYANLGARIEHFAAGEESRTLYVPLIRDSLPERRELFYVDVRGSDQPGRRLDAASRAEITIVDDD